MQQILFLIKLFLAMTNISHGLLKKLKVSSTIRIKHVRVISRIIKTMTYFFKFQSLQEQLSGEIESLKHTYYERLPINKQIQTQFQSITDQCLNPWITKKNMHSSYFAREQVHIRLQTRSWNIQFFLCQSVYTDTQ